MKPIMIAVALATPCLVATGTAAASEATEKLHTVVASDATFALDDSYSLDKVAAAFAKIGPDVVYTIARDTWASWWPAPESTGSTFTQPNMFRRSDGACASAAGLTKYGAEIVPELYGASVVMAERLCKSVNYNGLPAGTPVVVWGVRDDDWVIVVTLDGGRYQLQHAEDLAPGAAGAAAPTASLHAYLGALELDHLGAVDPAAKAAGESLAKSVKDYNKCAVPIFEKAEKQIAALSDRLPSAARAAKSEAINKKATARREKACGKHATAYIKTLVDALTDRDAKRRAIATSAKRLLGE